MIRVLHNLSLIMMAFIIFIMLSPCHLNIYYARIDGVVNDDDLENSANEYDVLDSSNMMILLSSSSSSSRSSSSSSYIKEKLNHRSLLSTDQLAVISLPSSVNDNIHQATIQQSNNENNVQLSHDPNYSTMITKNNQTIRYKIDSLCSGCRYVYTSHEVNEATPTCWNEIERLLLIDTNNLSMIDVAIVVSTIYPNHCHRCNPNSCNDDDKRYYRPDDIISNQYIQYAKTHYLKSLNDHHLPINILKSQNDLNIFISNTSNLYPNRNYFMEFNPSIIQLSINHIPKQLLSQLQQSDNTDNNNYYYLASYRVSNHHHCLKWPEDVTIHKYNNKVIPSIDYLGIAILDINLNIIIETVVDIRNVLISNNIPGMKSDSLYQDGRLFLLNNQIYLGSYTRLYPIYLIPPPINNEDIVQMPHYMTAEQKDNQTYDNDNNSLLNVYIHRIGYCSNDMGYQRYGKSYNYFYDRNQQRIVLEVYPMGPKEYIDTTTNCQLSNQNIDFILPNQPIPLDSYSTTDEITFSQYHIMKFPFSNNRGNYCCISINASEYTNHTTTLLLGISHIASQKIYEPTTLNLNNHIYFHNFYIMESIPPYNIVARSGKFCLNYPKYSNNKHDNDNDTNEIHFNNPRQKTKFQIGEDSYHCAMIHFVTGMTEALHDSNQIIISYGIDDCYSRFIMISKEHILSLLFFE